MKAACRAIARAAASTPRSTILRSLVAARVAEVPLIAKHAAPAVDGEAVRFLNLHEYQAKDLMQSMGVQVQKGRPAKTAEEAHAVAKWIKEGNSSADLIVKAQIHAGGRGKGTFTSGFKGGVKICSTPEQVHEYAGKMLGGRLVTKQTGPEGQLCTTVLINEGVTITRELYFAILLDRKHNGPVIVASTQGGMDIEEVAEKNPSAIITHPVSVTTGLSMEEARDLAVRLKFAPKLVDKAAHQMRALYALFAGTDATQVEINPLAECYVKNGATDLVLAVDAKLNFDDNASFRRKEIYDLRDVSQEDPRDVAAEAAGLNYIGLDGNIGCMVNGAGLAMATMDIIKLHGGAPANFLDVGGGATADQVKAAFKILTSDPQVKAILVNIFGGIMKCDTIANGIIQAAKEVKLSVPLVVRLEGTNVELGKKLLQGSGIKLTTADDLDDAAKKAVATIGH